MKKLFFIVGLILSLLGFYEVLKISHMHFMSEGSCPTLGIIPACYVVFISYAFMVSGWLGRIVLSINPVTQILFWFGFLTAFSFALLGSSGEIFGFASCPKTDGGFPKCFISLAFVSVIGVMWVLYKRFSTAMRRMP